MHHTRNFDWDLVKLQIADSDSRRVENRQTGSSFKQIVVNCFAKSEASLTSTVWLFKAFEKIKTMCFQEPWSRLQFMTLFQTAAWLVSLFRKGGGGQALPINGCKTGCHALLLADKCLLKHSESHVTQ